MTDDMVKCPDCGLICAKSMMKYHKESNECLAKVFGVASGYDTK